MCHRGPEPKQRERALPCHFTDGSAAACGFKTTCETTGNGSRAKPLNGQVDGNKRRTVKFSLIPASARPTDLVPAGRHRSLPVLYRELYRILRGHRRAIALALWGCRRRRS